MAVLIYTGREGCLGISSSRHSGSSRSYILTFSSDILGVTWRDIGFIVSLYIFYFVTVLYDELRVLLFPRFRR